MPLQSNNEVLFGAAGSRKTQHVIETAITAADDRVLVLTYTINNQNEIKERIRREGGGVIPKNISVMGWFQFLINQCVRPYQVELTKEPFYIKGLNFVGEPPRYAKKSELRRYVDSNGDIYRNRVSSFVERLDKETSGAVISRLERIYDVILIDEIQDFVGYDLEILDLLFNSSIKIRMVGDPRQSILETSRVRKNKKYKGFGLIDWFDERKNICDHENKHISYRCNQDICDFADSIFPSMNGTESSNNTITGHDGIFQIEEDKVGAYLENYPRVRVLRYSKASNTLGYPAFNIGVAKGATFDRVLIFPTQSMLKFLAERDHSELTTPEKLYVAVTRAKYSVTFAIPIGEDFGLPTPDL